jgi:NADH-quinone oxidoreductase subunit M
MIYSRLDNPENERLTDLNGRELAIMVPLLIGIVWLGLYPAPVLRRMEPAAQRYLQLTQPPQAVTPVAVTGSAPEVRP